MFPSLVVLPIWIIVALVWPIVETLHALQTKSSERKVWLFYWLCYAAGTWLLYYFEWLIKIPFLILGFYMDIYYEAQIAVVFYLVFPKTRGIFLLQEHLESNASAIGVAASEKMKDMALVVRERLVDLNKRLH
mmetsp:Transcript_15/g.47  ORF Transcript_15/g.47 Transcript_15/m.47 type:complete len:133 (-) Transcript_15:93-491(-)